MVTAMVAQEEVPVLITVAEAERICSMSRNAGYALVDNEWADFVVRYGGKKRSIRVNRARLLEWANGQKAA